MDRQQMIAHLTLHGWEACRRFDGEPFGVLQDRRWLVYWDRLAEQVKEHHYPGAFQPLTYASITLAELSDDLLVMLIEFIEAHHG